MAETTTIKVTNNVRDKLADLKIDNEGYSVIIARLIAENEQLKEDKEKLYKVALATSDSVALVNNVHKATWLIIQVANDNFSTSEEKLSLLKRLLKEMLEVDSSSVIEAIDILEDGSENNLPEWLLSFKSYVEDFSS